MNERIKELLEQAGFDVNRILAPHPGGFPRDDYLALESFAELIVEDCCQQLLEEDIRHDGYGYNQYGLHDKLRKHFGFKK